LPLGSLSACDPDEDNVLGAIDTEPGVLNDEVRFGVLLIDLVAVTQRYPKGRLTCSFSAAVVNLVTVPEEIIRRMRAGFRSEPPA
jgi:hypothetical protein